jgi:membrane fusion protein, heavy metal efflux system
MKSNIINNSTDSGLPSPLHARTGKSGLQVLCVIICMPFLLFQCTTDHTHEAEDNHSHAETHAEGTHHEDENLVTLTQTQLASAGIAFGTFDTINTSGFVRANGVLDLPPQNVAAISSPMPGFVKKANYLVGNQVKKGAVLAVIEHPDFLKMQEEYMTLTSQLAYLKAEWLRQKQLDSANIAAKKSFQQAEATYKASLAREQSLEKQLLYVGLQPGEIREGKLSSTIYIRAPFSGYITQLNTHNGMYVQPEQELYEMIDMEHMHMELNVFEKDIPNVKVGQEIKFRIASLGEQEYEGEVFLVGKSFDKDHKTIRVHGHIHEDSKAFIRGLYLEATIFTGDQQVRALPEVAIVRDEGQYYMFVTQLPAHQEHGNHDEDKNHEHPHGEEGTENHNEHDDHEGEESHEHPHEGATSSVTFQRIQVVTGISQNGWMEIKNSPKLPFGAQIVVKGAYDLYSEMKKGEASHAH